MNASEEKDKLEPISDEALIAMSGSKLNGLIERHGLFKESAPALEIKKRRRRLLNRGYGSRTRKRRKMEDTALENENEALKKKLEDMQNYREKVVNETAEFTEEFEEKKSEVELLAEEERLLKEKNEQLKLQKS